MNEKGEGLKRRDVGLREVGGANDPSSFWTQKDLATLVEREARIRRITRKPVQLDLFEGGRS